MNQFFLFVCFLFASVYMYGQGAFSYDTIRTNRQKQQDQPVYYGTPSFSYDTIRSNRNATPRYSIASTPKDNNGNVHAGKSDKQSASSFDKRKLFFGGNIGMSFGDYTLVDISPQVGYAFSQYFSAGAGVSFTYLNKENYNYEFTRTYLGMNVFANAYPMKYIALSLQPGVDYMWASDTYANGAKITLNKAIPTFVVGAGVRIPVGNTGGMIMMLKYDLVQNEHSPYGNTVFYSVGYVIGF